MKKVLFFVVLIAITLTALFPQSSFALPLESEEKAMLELLNEERVAHDLPLLKIDWDMTELAREHSEEMAELNYFEHRSPISGDLLDRLEAKNFVDWKIAGENLAAAPTAEVAFKALMESDSHRDNILNPHFTHVGIGVAASSMHGKLFTQEFVAKEEPVVAVDQKVLPLANESRISFRLLAPATVTVEIYDLAGDPLAVVTEGELRQAGPVELVWDGKIKSTSDDASQKFEYRVTYQSAIGQGTASVVERISPDLVNVERKSFSILLFLQNVLENLLNGLFSLVSS